MNKNYSINLITRKNWKMAKKCGVLWLGWEKFVDWQQSIIDLLKLHVKYLKWFLGKLISSDIDIKRQ